MPVLLEELTIQRRYSSCEYQENKINQFFSSIHYVQMPRKMNLITTFRLYTPFTCRRNETVI